VTITTIDKKNPPPEDTGYNPPKKGAKEVKNPNGQGKGWQDKKGNVWVPTPGMHGGEGWTVQYPNGGHHHVYPGGKVRKATKQSSPVGGGTMIVGGAVALIWLFANDATGVGVADDVLIPATAGLVVMGVDQIYGEYVCDCGESWYGF